MGDLSATFCESDRSSNKSYTYDHMYREFINKNGLQPIEEYNDPTHTPRPRTQLQTISTCDAEDGNAAYSNGHIDDILLPKYIADIVYVPRTCETMGYRSGHVPLDCSLLSYKLIKLHHSCTQATDPTAAQTT